MQTITNHITNFTHEIAENDLLELLCLEWKARSEGCLAYTLSNWSWVFLDKNIQAYPKEALLFYSEQMETITEHPNFDTLLNRHQQTKQQMYAQIRSQQETAEQQRQEKLNNSSENPADYYAAALAEEYTARKKFRTTEHELQYQGVTFQEHHVSFLVAAWLKGATPEELKQSIGYSYYLTNYPVDTEAGESFQMLNLHQPNGKAWLHVYNTVSAARARASTSLNIAEQETGSRGTAIIFRVEESKVTTIGDDNTTLSCVYY